MKATKVNFEKIEVLLLNKESFRYQNLNNTPVQETLNLVSNVRTFKKMAEEYLVYLDKVYFSKVCRWLHFFNEQYLNMLGWYTKTVIAVVGHASRQWVMLAQTNEEFELSKTVYLKLINADKPWKITNLQAASYLLGIALFYGSYPGLMIRPIKAYIPKLPETLWTVHLKELFQYLFVKYETTDFLLNHIDRLTPFEAKVYAQLLCGQSLRKIHGLPVTPSKKVSTLFYTKAPYSIKFKDQILKRSLNFCQILIAKPNASILLFEIIQNSKVYEHHFHHFVQDVDYWQSVLVLLNQKHLRSYSTQEYVDYFEYMRYQSDTPNFILGKSLRRINREIEAWHNHKSMLKQQELLVYKWKPSTNEENQVWHYNDDYRIKELTTGEELFYEGANLKHCVFSYLNYCFGGLTHIWSLQKKEKGEYHSQITIEVKHNNITQFSGKSNRKATPKEKQIIKKWSKQYNYKFYLIND